jgi:hypothetical protein
MRIVAEASRRRRVIELSIRRRDRRRIIGEGALHRCDGIFGSLGIAVKAPNIWWSIQSLGETTDLTDQKRIFTD